MLKEAWVTIVTIVVGAAIMAGIACIGDGHFVTQFKAGIVLLLVAIVSVMSAMAICCFIGKKLFGEGAETISLAAGFFVVGPFLFVPLLVKLLNAMMR
jgi:hypothetical protein